MVLEGGSRYTAVVKVPSAGSGELTFRVEATDGAGNFNSSSDRSTGIDDNDPPRVLSVRTLSSVMAGKELSISIEAIDNIRIEGSLLTWYLSSDPYRTDVEMEWSGSLLTASFTVDENAYGYLYWTAVITDTSGNSVTTRKSEVRIVQPPMGPGPDDEGPEPVELPLDGEDLDQDGMDDLWEYYNGLDITQDDSGEDPDGDGATNMEEFREATAPMDALHYPVGMDDDDDGSDGRDLTYIVLISAGAVLLLLIFISALLFSRKI
jgi:hypothetical protein